MQRRYWAASVRHGAAPDAASACTATVSKICLLPVLDILQLQHR